jgi:hypothetical protein
LLCHCFWYCRFGRHNSFDQIWSFHGLSYLTICDATQSPKLTFCVEWCFATQVDWKPLGHLPPLTDEEWNTEFDRYKQYPEYNECVQILRCNETQFRPSSLFQVSYCTFSQIGPWNASVRI